MALPSMQRLQYLADTIPEKLQQIPESDFAHKPAPGKWSKKEILGHLIDSAANNHQRFVRTQFEDVPVIFYDPDNWNDHGYYNTMNSAYLISFWQAHNRHLAELANRIPTEYLDKECNTGGETNVTLKWLIDDYVDHLEHHLKEIVDY